MFDNITFQISGYQVSEFKDLVTNRINQSPQFWGDRWLADWHNLRLYYYPKSGILKVSNSLHKFYNAAVKGYGVYNHDDFSYSMVMETITYLEQAWGRTSSEMRLLGKFEYGLNIHTGGLKPYNDIIERYQSIVTTATNPFNVFYNSGGKPYSKFCQFTGHTVKCYDKGKQAGISGKNLMRFEIVHHNSIKTREVLRKETILVEDLKSKEVWFNCFNVIKKNYDNIRVLAFPVDGIDAYTKTLCFSYPPLTKDYRKSLQKNYSELKAAHDKVKKDNNSPHFLIRENLERKFSDLINQ